MDVKFLEKFYKKVIYNQFSSDTPESYKASLQNPIVQVEPKIPKDAKLVIQQEEQKKKNNGTQCKTKRRGRKKGYRLKKKIEPQISAEPVSQFTRQKKKPGPKPGSKRVKKPQITIQRQNLKKKRKSDQPQESQSSQNQHGQQQSDQAQNSNEENSESQQQQNQNSVQQIDFKTANQHLANMNTSHKQLQKGHLQSTELKSNKICIQKINIYFGGFQPSSKKGQYLNDKHFQDGNGFRGDLNLKKLQTCSYARMQVQQENDPYYDISKRIWTLDMEIELINEFMNTSAASPNIVIRNLMKKFGRNKLFVEKQIKNKKVEMFKTSIQKFIDSFKGKTLCNQEQIKEMENILKNLNCSSPKNYFIARFIHDFYLKNVEAISVTLLSEYINKLIKQDNVSLQKLIQKQQPIQQEQQQSQKRKSSYEQYALNAVSKLVSNYTYELGDD